jgi:hypothetical protein
MAPPCKHNSPILPDPYHPNSAYCHLCYLYEVDEKYRALWDGLPIPQETTPEGKNLPCLFLGKVIDKLDCPCPGKWIRTCGVKKVCTIEQCKLCTDYQEGTLI